MGRSGPPTTGTGQYGGASPGSRCCPDEAEVPLPSQVPRLKPRPGQDSLGVRVRAFRPDVLPSDGGLADGGGWQYLT